MPQLIEQIQTVLAPLSAGGSWYQVNTQQPPTYPYVVFHRIVSTTTNTLEGATNVQNTRIQIDSVSDLISEASALEKTVATAMATFGALKLTQRDIYDPKQKAHKCSADYSCWSTD